MRGWRAHLLLATLLAAAGCGTDGTSVPQPVPVPKVSLLRFSTPREQQTRTLCLGLPGAVPADGRVEARHVNTGAVTLADVSTTGSFALLLEGSDVTAIELRYINASGQRSDPAPLAQSGALGGPVLGAPTRNGPPVSAPDGAGDVVVSNDGGAGQPLLFSATPGAVVYVANVSNGAVARTTTDTIGRFSAKVAASSGDAIQVVLANPQDESDTSNYLTFIVP